MKIEKQTQYKLTLNEHEFAALFLGVYERFFGTNLNDPNGGFMRCIKAEMDSRAKEV